jgi:integrase
MVSDGRGLSLDVLPSGKMSWLYRYRLEGNYGRVTLGLYRDLTLKAARVKRDELAAQVASGKAPAVEAKQRRAGLSTNPTVRDFGERYYKEQVVKNWKDPKAIRRYLDNEIFPTLGEKALKDVNALDVQGLVYRKRDSGRVAAAIQLRMVVKQIFDYAIETRLVTVNPAAMVATRYIGKARKRSRVLSPSEIRLYLRTIYQSNIRRQFKLALHIILLTLSRKSELLLARWEDVNLDTGEWLIPGRNAKTGKPHLVYLSTQCVAMFRELKALAGDSDLVLPGRGSLTRPFAKNALNKAVIRNSAGILGKGLDIRADGGYVVAPPSLHPSGLLYEWLTPDQPLADVPPWMLAKLAEAKPAPVAPSRTSETIAEGGRNAALMSLGGTMRRRGMALKAIEAGLLKQNEACCKPPLPASEVRDIARSVARYEPAAPVRSVDPPAQASQPRQWPAPPAETAYYGLAGEFVRLVEPHTEADPAALMFQFLAAIGSIIGGGPHYCAGADRHFTNLYIILVGNSSKARKGTSWSEVHRICQLIDIAWTKTRILSGLTSGEGLTHAVRDEITESVAIKEKGRVIDRQDQVTDLGEKDKRLLCVEGELAQTLQCAAREGSTLSPVIRQAWDGAVLRGWRKVQRQPVPRLISQSSGISPIQSCKIC